jgi:hypothetical protein
MLESIADDCLKSSLIGPNARLYSLLGNAHLVPGARLSTLSVMAMIFGAYSSRITIWQNQVPYSSYTARLIEAVVVCPWTFLKQPTATHRSACVP